MVVMGGWKLSTKDTVCESTDWRWPFEMLPLPLLLLTLYQ